MYFAQEGQCVQNKICSYKSKANSNGVYCYVDVSQNSPNSNKIISSTITESGAGTNSGTGTFYFLNGVINISLTNESNSAVLKHSICYVISINSDSIVKYSTFAENKHQLSGQATAFHQGASTSVKFNINSCNYLNNIGTHSIICFHGLTTNVSNCNFIGNQIIEFTFYSSSPMTISDSYIDYLKSTSGTIIIMQNTLKNEINLNLHHFSTFKCQAQMPFLAENDVTFDIFIIDLSYTIFVIFPIIIL